MEKSRIIARRSVKSVMNERNLLASLKHPFIVNMHYAYQDREKLYLLMDLKPGGDLRYHLIQNKKFSEDQSMFFISCVLIALEYLHDNRVIHRDIKPENLVLDYNGYLSVTDFGIARLCTPDNKSETSGTPGYMSPEVLFRQNHTIVSDYFAVGVLAHEFMTGKRPYSGKSRKEIRDAILSKKIELKAENIPHNWNKDVGDFINKLLQRKPQNRLGFWGISEIKSHPWLKRVDWGSIIKYKLVAPFIPNSIDNFDTKQVSAGWGEDTEQIDLELASIQNMFAGYQYGRTSTLDN